MGYIEKSILIIGQSLLVFLGLLQLVVLFPDQFESEFSLSEISLIEFAFWIAFFMVSQRYYHASLAANLKLKQILYFPLRNLGLFVLFWLVVLIGALLISTDALSNIIIFEAENENILQIIDFLIILFCIYWATPKAANDLKKRLMALIRFKKNV